MLYEVITIEVRQNGAAIYPSVSGFPACRNIAVTQTRQWVNSFMLLSAGEAHPVARSDSLLRSLMLPPPVPGRQDCAAVRILPL